MVLFANFIYNVHGRLLVWLGHWIHRMYCWFQFILLCYLDSVMTMKPRSACWIQPFWYLFVKSRMKGQVPMPPIELLSVRHGYLVWNEAFNSHRTLFSEEVKKCSGFFISYLGMTVLLGLLVVNRLNCFFVQHNWLDLFLDRVKSCLCGLVSPQWST